MISRIFVSRPIFAWVISIVIMLAGVGAILTLPIEQYPDVAPPQVNIRATYTGASAETLESSVTQVIEQQLTGLDGLIYFDSTSSAEGLVTIRVTFEQGTDPDIAQVQVQNRVQQAVSRLPQQVQQQGLTVTKSNSDFLLVAAVYDETDRATDGDVADYIASKLQERIGRTPGVGDTNLFGAQYAMRIWLDPGRLFSYGLVPSDVIAAIEAQNAQVAAGQIGAQPSPSNQMLNAIVTARSRLTTPDEFRRIVVKTETSGARVLLEDVARVELGKESYTRFTRFNRHPAAGIAVQLAPGADALETAEAVKELIDGQAEAMPDGYRVAYPRDSTAFIRLSIEEVVKTLIEAIVLVVVVMFVFLQNWRATLIPTIAVPVVVLGTFGVLAALGYSINTLTLFGLVLSIGLLVDDAIVVVENVERVMEEEPDLSPREATLKSMGEIQTALIAIALVLSAVFLPMAFFGGSTGVIYRQFSVTVISAMALSVVVALVLTPALTATMLKRRSASEKPRRFTGGLFRSAARLFDRGYAKVQSGYLAGVRFALRRIWLALLVFCGAVVMFVFLQNWRATLIPTIAVPVVVLGTFGVLAALGYSINTLTLFGLVLSIGLLVDDAIVVVENVERVMEEEPDLSPREATLKSMGEIQTALIAIALVLSAVFLPMAFFGGSTGVIYRQFSVTVISAMALSVVVALVLTPALTATMLKRRSASEKPRRFTGGLFRSAARLFDRGYAKVQSGYLAGVRFALRRIWLALLVFCGAVAGLVFLFLQLPGGFLPVEDQGFGIVQYTLPPGATQTRTVAAAQGIEDHFLGPEEANVDGLFTISGFRFSGSGQNVGQGFVQFKPWDEREGEENTAASITRRATRDVGGALRDVQFFALTPPSVQGLGQSNGFTMQLQNTGELGRTEFKALRDELLGTASSDPTLTRVRPNGLEDVPTLQVRIDDEKVGALGIDQADVDATLSAAWGGVYVNDFVDRGRVKRVYVQGEAAYRGAAEDLAGWYVRTSSGQMAPFSSFATVEWGQAPTTLTRFNGFPSFEIQGQAAEGFSSGQAMEKMLELSGKLQGTSVAWSSLSYQERLSAGQAPLLYALSLLVVFLCLAALYESWSIPFSVMLVIPLGIVGAVIAVTLRGLENDVYFQIGLLTTIGLSAKNAILIVEFAERAEREGKSAYDAALEAAQLRLRPILMTSLAFIFGVLPLAISTGAGAQSRVAIGTAVIGGMMTATVLAIFYVPFFFVLIRRLLTRRQPKGGDAPAADVPVPAE